MSRERLRFGRVVPKAYRALWTLDQYVRESVDPTLLELVKMRASILNGCSYCLDLHARDALKSGEDVRRVVGVAAWRESSLFTDDERAALELTDAVTRLGDAGVPDDVWDRAHKAFGEEGVANLLTAIVTINAWNRVAVTTQYPSPSLEEGGLGE